LRRTDGELQFVECVRQTEHRRGLDTQLVVAAAQVLDERVPADQRNHWGIT
jgi:hypothetical protein